jgi:NADP-dependent 3-hydroxy acid dehydrogenase YdfG
MSLAGEKLYDHTAWVTGASSGIGAATALRLAEHGADVVIGARRIEKLRAVAEEIRAACPERKVTALPLDVNDAESVDAWVRQAEDEAGPCDILVNNAGLAAGTGSVVEADVADWELMLETNVRSVFLLTKRLLPGMIERGRGDIVMIASVAGSDPYPGGNVYCATKAAVQAFATSLRAEVLGKNIRVFTMDPGLVETEFSIVRLKDEDKAKGVYSGLTPLTGEDVADCVGFALTRPRHMCVDRMLILATAQAGTRAFHRES